MALTLYKGASLDYAVMPSDEPIDVEHHEFLVPDDDVDASAAGSPSGVGVHWADSRGNRPGEISHNDGPVVIDFEM